MLLLLELLRSGKEVWSRRHPYRWVAGNNRNLVYFSIGHDVMLPAEDLDDDRFELEIVTCLTNPRSRHPLPRRLDPVHSTNRSSRHRYPRR